MQTYNDSTPISAQWADQWGHEPADMLPRKKTPARNSKRAKMRAKKNAYHSKTMAEV